MGDPRVAQTYEDFIVCMNSPMSDSLIESDPISKLPVYKEKLKMVCARYIEKLPLDKLMSYLYEYVTYLTTHKTLSHVTVNKYFIEQNCLSSLVIDTVYRECFVFSQRFVDTYINNVMLFKNNELYLSLAK
jgi:hypothetical protein